MRNFQIQIRLIDAGTGEPDASFMSERISDLEARHVFSNAVDAVRQIPEEILCWRCFAMKPREAFTNRGVQDWPEDATCKTCEGYHARSK